LLQEIASGLQQTYYLTQSVGRFMKRRLRENGLSIVWLVLFFFTFGGTTSRSPSCRGAPDGHIAAGLLRDERFDYLNNLLLLMAG
jgi:hypothetical protein